MSLANLAETWKIPTPDLCRRKPLTPHVPELVFGMATAKRTADYRKNQNKADNTCAVIITHQVPPPTPITSPLVFSQTL